MDKTELQKAVIGWRRRIHQYPELGNEEFKTARLVEKALRTLRIPSKRLGPTGIVGILKGGRARAASRCIALRADMDALPLTERVRHSFRSRRPGIMHACGHDAHVAMLLGAAALLSKRRASLEGTVKFFFQPNEEGAGGAKALIERGAMRNPRVDAVYGLHVNPRFRSGTGAVKEGPLMAAVDKFTIEVKGRGGHAAYPHEGRDAIVIASELILALQTIVARKLDPLDAAVVTVGTIQGGTRFNILAESAHLTGTVRTLSEDCHRRIPGLIRDVVAHVCRAHGAQGVLQYERVGSVLSNSKEAAALARRAAEKIFGAARVLSPERPTMGGEDFSEYLRFAPGCFIYVGTGNPRLAAEKPWHHPEFALDESALGPGARLLAAISEDFLKGGFGP